MEVKDGHNSINVADTAVDDALDMTVTVTNVPEPAGNVQAQVLSTHQIRVTWSAPDSANDNYISHYELAYRELFPKNPPFTGPDVFDEWTTLTLDRDTRQALLEDLQPLSFYDIALRAVQKGVDAPEVRVSPMPKTLVHPCRYISDTFRNWHDIHKYVLLRPGPTTLDFTAEPEYIDSEEIGFGPGIGTRTYLCNEQGRVSPPGRNPSYKSDSVPLNDPDLDRGSGTFRTISSTWTNACTQCHIAGWLPIRATGTH